MSGGVRWVRAVGAAAGTLTLICACGGGANATGPGDAAVEPVDAPTQGEASTESGSSQDAATGPAPQVDFATRCAGSGVLVCEGFDTTDRFQPAHWPGSGLYPGSCASCDFQDTAVKASGNSSWRLEIPSNTGPRPAGNWAQHFGQSTFGPTTANRTFYVQFSFRPDDHWVGFDWAKTGPAGYGTSPKIVIFHNFTSGTCASEEITTVNHSGTARPTGYIECGARGLYTDYDGVTYNPSNPPYLLQAGFTEPAPFTGFQARYPDWCTPSDTCQEGVSYFTFQPSTWHVLEYKVHVGDWGVANSSIEAWVAPFGQPLRKWMNVRAIDLTSNNVAGDLGFDALTLTQFMTNKDPTLPNPDTFVWYDELIVSTQPIPAPYGPSPP